MNLRCAIYARYSSDQQSPASIADQIRKCTEHAEEQGWHVLEEHVYSDAAVSGEGSDRHGLQELLLATEQRPRLFDAVLVDDTSRLSRDRNAQGNLVAHLKFKDIRFVAVSQGIDSTDDQSDVLLTVHGLVDSLYTKELRKKTHRGLEGRVLAGFHTGGRCFGYQIEHDVEGVRQVIDESEAAIVRAIFEKSAAGMSLKKIAAQLNADRVPTPRPRKGRTLHTWCPTAIRAMLRNELYTGKVIWNRTQFIKRPGTNKRVPRERPRSDWKIVERPELRIIAADLWERVLERQRLMIEVYGWAGKGINKASSSPFLLTGFLKCGVCTGNLIIVGGKGKKQVRKFYGCGQHFYRGACSNGLTIPQSEIEQNLFSRLQAEVLTPEVIEYTVQEFMRRIREQSRRAPDERAAIEARRDQVKQELGRLAQAIAETGPISALIQSITERERELEQLSQRFETNGRGLIEAHPGNVRDFVVAGLKELQSLLAVDTIRARAELAKHTREIKMVPEIGHDGQLQYWAEGDWSLFSWGSDFAMVAGEGFEPSTFGL